MSERYKQVFGYAVLVTFVTLGCLAAVQIIAGLPCWADKKVEWVGALGTIAAFAGTIFIATSESRARHRDAIDVAVLVCLEISFDHTWLLNELPKFISKLKMEETPGGSQYWKRMADEIAERCQWPDEKLAKLICVGGKTAERMALTKAVLKNGATHMRNYASSLGLDGEVELKKKCLEDLVGAEDALKRAGDSMLGFVGEHRAD